jgi:hypothetical protein
MSGLRKTLIMHIRARQPFALSLDEVHQIARGLGKKESNAERQLRQSRSPEIKTNYNDKGHIISYTHAKTQAKDPKQ